MSLPMPHRQLLALLTLVTLLTSCEQFATKHVGDLRARGSALISVPLDATSGGEQYEGSGKEVAQALAVAFRRHVGRVDIMSSIGRGAFAAGPGRGASPGTGSFAESMDTRTGASRYDYVVIPTILHWEDRDVRKSHRYGEIEIGVRVVRASDGALLADWRISKPSKVSTFFRGSIADQLAEPIREYVDDLFAGKVR